MLATHNAGKLVELQELLAGRARGGLERGARPARAGRGWRDLRRQRADQGARRGGASGLPALADDSGLVAYGLDGRPGVRSARWAGPGGDFAPAMARVRDELAARFGSFAAAERGAAFVAVLCLAWPDGHEELAEGRVEGLLVDPPRGRGGFGYDPMFQPAGGSLTFGELPRAAKQAQSHRGRALRAMLALCFGGRAAGAPSAGKASAPPARR